MTKYVNNNGVSEMWLNIKNWVTSQLLGKSNVGHTHSASDITSGLSTVATSGSYNDLTDKPTIPTVNNATLTIKKNGTTVKTFTANASSNVTANITVPTKTSELTNDSHVSITTETDTTSTGTPAHGGTFTCIDSVTRDSNGHVTKVNTKTVTLPSDSNTDTLVTQNVSTANENHPILLSATKDATTNQGAKTSIFASGVKVNPSTGTVTATTFSGTLSGNASSATQFSANKDVTLTGDVTGTASSKAGWSVATTLANSGVTAGTYGPGADVTGNNNATISVPEITVDAKGRVTSVTNRTLTCKNNTYNVYNKTLTIQKNGTNVATFTSNSNTNVTANISVPTKTSDLTNDSGFLTSHQDLSGYIPRSGGYVFNGIEYSRPDSSAYLRFCGGYQETGGASLILHGKIYTNANFVLKTTNGTDKTCSLIGGYNGLLQWNGSKFNVSNQLHFELSNANLRIGSNASGDHYVRYYWSGEMSSTLNQFFPAANNAYNLGRSGNIWANVYIGNSPIVTSDIRQKTQIQDIDDALLDAWESINPKTFKMVSAVEKKGESARFHTGYIAQDIQKACTDNNLDISKYGLFCHDSWEEQEEKKDENGQVIESYRPKGDLYSLRYEEALVVECAYLRKKNKELQEQLDKLSARLDKLESVQTK